MKFFSCGLMLSMTAAQMFMISAQAAPVGALLTPGKLGSTVKIVGTLIPSTTLPTVGPLGNVSINGALKAVPPLFSISLHVPPALGDVTVSEALVRVENQRLTQAPIAGVGTLNATLAPVVVKIVEIEAKIP